MEIQISTFSHMRLEYSIGFAKQQLGKVRKNEVFNRFFRKTAYCINLVINYFFDFNK